MVYIYILEKEEKHQSKIVGNIFLDLPWLWVLTL